MNIAYLMYSNEYILFTFLKPRIWSTEASFQWAACAACAASSARKRPALISSEANFLDSQIWLNRIPIFFLKFLKRFFFLRTRFWIFFSSRSKSTSADFSQVEKKLERKTGKKHFGQNFGLFGSSGFFPSKHLMQKNDRYFFCQLFPLVALTKLNSSA